MQYTGEMKRPMISVILPSIRKGNLDKYLEISENRHILRIK